MNKYLDYSKSFFIQIDHTSRCNLQCPQCARTIDGKLNPSLPMGELELDDYRRIFSGSWIKQVKNILFCGNYGDAAISESFKPAVSFLKDIGIPSISLITNGSLRGAGWWQDLARMLDKKRDKVVFSIDGLKDTNSIYRVNSNWDRIIENCSAFIDAGGRARWDFLVFSHNEHQVDEAKLLAKKIGFAEFAIKKTNRFINEKNYLSGKSEQEVTTSKINPSLSSPNKNSPFIPEGAKKFDSIINQYGNWENYINETKINCMYHRWGGGVFIDFKACLWPCTWLASPIYHHGETNTSKKQIQRIIKQYGENFNSLREHSFEDVIDHPWFREELVKSWSGKTTDLIPKLLTCGRTCDNLYDFSSGSDKNREIIKL